MKIVVIGGGAAGIFTAICCKEKRPDCEVLVLEKTNQLLSKVRISGGGRCNVTHACFIPKDLVENYPRGKKELLGPFHTFGPTQTIEWFANRGVDLKTEADGRMFPTTDSSETIIQCLLKSAEEAGVVIRKQQKISKIEKGFTIYCGEETIHADKLVLATGSNAWGHNVACEMGHTIISPVPSLFTFNVPTSPLLDLSGISVPNAEISILGYKQRGPILLTHWGFSGPAAIKLSAFAARDLSACNYQAPLKINWTCTQNLFETLQNENHIPQLLPKKLQSALLKEFNFKNRSKKQLQKIADKFENDTYLVEGKTTYKQEFVTAGGVNLKEINFKTMESQICPGLHFAGEILNIDGITGGFNFQNAWTGSYLIGNAL